MPTCGSRSCSKRFGDSQRRRRVRRWSASTNAWRRPAAARAPAPPGWRWPRTTAPAPTVTSARTGATATSYASTRPGVSKRKVHVSNSGAGSVSLAVSGCSIQVRVRTWVHAGGRQALRGGCGGGAAAAAGARARRAAHGPARPRARAAGQRHAGRGARLPLQEEPALLVRSQNEEGQSRPFILRIDFLLSNGLGEADCGTL